MHPRGNGTTPHHHHPREQDIGTHDLENQAKQDDALNKPAAEASFKDRIAHFTWPWFASTMSTGAIAVVLHSTPNQFRGLQTIGKIFYIFDIVLFLALTTCMALRAYWYPKRFRASLHHPVEGLFLGAYWVSVSLILNAAQGYGVPASGSWLPRALLVVFWTYCGIVLCVGVGQYYVFFQKERLSINDAVPAWIFPIYPLLVIGPMAGQFIPSQPQDRAFEMWVGAVMLQGLAWTVAIMMYSMYTQRLMTSTLPAPPTRPGMYVSVGPAGYTAAGLISLGTQARNVLAPDTFGTVGIAAGEIVRLIGIMSGFFIVIFAFWFFCISTVAVLAGSRKMTFTLNWWAFVFPNAGLTLAAIQVGSVLGSPAINGICSALTVMLVIMWFVCAVGNVMAVWQAKITWPGRDEDKDMAHMGWGKKAWAEEKR